MNKLLLALLTTSAILTGCADEANVASRNLGKAADNFEVNRRVVFYNGFLGLSDNVTYFVEQLETSKASPHFYRVTFKPSTIIPDIRVQ